MVDCVVEIPLAGTGGVSMAGQAKPAAASSFFAGPENRLVEIAVRSVLGGDANGYSPLVLYGPSGAGKSHIARGMASEWKSRSRRDRVLCTTATDFARELADAIESQAVVDFREKYRIAALLVVEDLGMMVTRKSGKLNAQEELVYTLDAAAVRGSWVVVTASARPSELPGILPALQSRLTAGLTIPLAPPGLESRTAILEQLARVRKIHLSAPLARMLAEGLGGTASELAGALMQLEMPLRLDGRQIDAEAIEAFLANQPSAKRPSLHDIAQATAQHFSLKLTDLRSPARHRSLVTARGVAIYLARHLTKETLDEIGAYFGGRDHTTVLHGCRKTETQLNNDPAVREAVTQLWEGLCKR